MTKHLFFICPTDHLEKVIEQHFHEENYYITSLGNSINFDSQNMEEINALIERKSITEISFVLSDDNKIIVDAIKNRKFQGIMGLDGFFKEISKPIKQTKVLRHVFNTELPLITDCLNLKAQCLVPLLDSWLSEKVNINAMVYKRQENIFEDTQSYGIKSKRICLN